MDTIKIEKKNVMMIAHRGLSGIETESTSSAFVAAGNRSYFGIECDIHVTHDKKFVVIHDEKTSRVAQKDIDVEKKKFKKIRKLLPGQQLQFLTESYSKDVLEKFNAYKLDLDVDHSVLTKEIVDEVHANGHFVNCWTCDDKARATELIGMGVDYITTNILE